MKKKLILIALMIILSSSVFSQSSTIDGKGDKPDVLSENKDYVSKMYVSLNCSKGINSIRVYFFIGNANLFLVRDRDSYIGLSVATFEFTSNHSIEKIVDTGISFKSYKSGEAYDFFISSSILKKRSGNIIAIIFNQFYECETEIFFKAS